MGITCDTVYSLKDWAEHLGGVEFPFCSDYWPHGTVTRAYGVFNEEIGRPDRTILVLDRDGVVRYIDMHALREAPDMTEVEEELAKLR